MTTTENVTVYGCDFCKKKLFRKHAMERHEKYCLGKPENQPACSGCVFLKETTVDISTGSDYHGEEGYRAVKAFECTKLEKLLYPIKVLQKGLVERYPETFQDQELMPNKCEHTKFYLTDIEIIPFNNRYNIVK